MKKKLHRLNAIFAILLGTYILLAFSNNPPNGFTGAPGESTCQSCHMVVNNSFAGDVEILGLPADIQPDNVYSITIRVTYTAGNPTRSGVQLTTLNSNNQDAGSVVSTGAFLNSSSSGGRTYVEHTNAQPFTTNITDYTFTWKAPAGPVGEVITMYAAAVLGNGGSGNNFDRVLTGTTSGTISSAPAALSVTIGNVSDVTCFGGNDGAAEATATGGNPPYSFSWSTGFMGSFPNNLSEGIYTVTCTDAANMTATAMVTISESDEITISTTSITAIDCDSPNGSATVSVSGGNPSYIFDWSNGESGPTATLLPAGNNMLTVTDQENCEKVHAVFIPSSTTPPMADAGNATPLSCSNNIVVLDGSESSSGQSIRYNWTTNDGNIVSGADTDMPEVNQPGTYYLEVINDNNACSAIDSVLVLGDLDTPLSEAGADVTLPCNATSVFLDAGNSFGNGQIEFQWTTIDGNIISSPIEPLIEVNKTGTYICTVLQIGNGCTDSDTVEVLEPLRPEISITAIDTPGCFGESTGAIQVQIENGETPYSFIWSTGDTSQNIANISAGNYTLIVTDTASCMDTVMIAVPEPGPLEISFVVSPISEVGANDGVIETIISGGTEPYNLSWSTGDTLVLIDSLEPGDYIVTVTDRNNCSLTDTARIPSINCDDFQVSTSVLNAYNCPGANAGLVIINSITGGFSPYEINWSTGGTGLTIVSLGAGLYNLAITDSLGCMLRDTFEIVEEDTLAPIASAKNIMLYLDDNGMAFLSSGDINDGSFDNCVLDSIFIDQSNFNCSNLGQNQVVLTEIDQVGNTDTAHAEVMVLDTIAPAISCPDNIVSSNCNAISYDLPTVTDNCSANLQPTLIAGLASGSQFPIGSTLVTYEVRDESNNTAQCSFEVELINDLSVDSFAIENNCDTFLNLSVFASGGTGNYDLNWSSGQSGANIQINGSDTLLLIDANGCQLIEAFTFEAPSLPAISLDSMLNETNEDGNGAAYISPIGGVSPFAFNWYDENDNLVSEMEDLVGVSAGNYKLILIDDNGCADTLSVIIDKLVNTTNPLPGNDFKLFPNPAKDEVNIVVPSLYNRVFIIQMMDTKGKMVRSYEGLFDAVGNYKLEIGGLPEGIYLIRLQSNSDLMVKKLFIK